MNEVSCRVFCHNLRVLAQALFEFGVRSDFCAESQFAQKVIVNQDFLCKAARPGGLKFVEKVLQ